MLSHLYIDNLVMVDHLDLPLQPGMTVITGETGAGKSIMLDAIGLGLGDRASAELTGSAGPAAEIILTFEPAADSRAQAWLLERELATEDARCLLRRTINRDGRSRSWINGRPCTLADLRQLGGMLLDLYSQHEHQSLLEKDTQRRLLDEFGAAGRLAAQVGLLFDEWRRKRRRLEEIRDATAQGRAELQLLEYQRQELASLAPVPDEYAGLLIEQKQLANLENIRRTCLELTEGLQGEGERQPVLGFLAQARQALGALEDDRLQSVLELLSSAEIQLEEATRDLSRLADAPARDPARAAEVDERIAGFFDLARKHKVRPEALPELLEEISARLQAFNRRDEELAQLEQQEAQLAADWRKHAGRLSEQRAAAAERLATAVSEQLQALAIQGRFEVRMEPQRQPDRHGLEAVEFLVSTHPSAPSAPLSRIASGGELSRISLAIQVLTAKTGEVPTLIFDEVDVGIGGAVAEITGGLLRELAGHTQIITVTHLGQVACQGHNHLFVHKLMEADAARTRVSVLDEAGRVAEIARMLGGVELTPRTLEHAKEMYLAAQAAE